MPDLVKMALAPATIAAMSRATKGFGAGAGMGGLVGGAGGAAIGGVHAAREAHEQGAGVGGSVWAGLGGARRGFVRGALVGTAAGGAAGAAAPALAGRLGGHSLLRGASNFGQRQVHSLTGVGDAAYVRSIGGGAADAHDRLRGANQMLARAKDPKAAGKARNEIVAARRSFQAGVRSEERGLTSIPGYAKALLKDPRGTLTTGLKDQWHSMGAGGKALMFGAPVAGVANELRQGEDPSGEQRGRFERAGRLAGGAASGMLMPISIAGDLAAGGAMSAGLGKGGKFLDRALEGLRKRRGPPLPEPDPGGGTSQAEGYTLSDRAAGTAAESVTG